MSKQELSLPWASSPSQILNLMSYLTTAIMISIIIYFEPLIFSYMPESITHDTLLQGIGIFCGLMIISDLFKFISLKCNSYNITNDKILIKKGVLSSVTENIEMYRVKDQTIVKPLFLRIFGLGNIVLFTSDQTTPTVTLTAVRDVEAVVELVQEATLSSRKLHGVREID